MTTKMTIDPPTIEEPDKPEWKPPNWKFYLKNRNASLSDAIALSIDISPKQIKRATETDKEYRICYKARLKAARLEAAGEGKGSINVIERGKSNDGSDWIVDIASFVEFANGRWQNLPEQFQELGSNHSIKENGVRNDANRIVSRKAPNEFVAALIRFVAQIAIRAQNKGTPLDLYEFPGTKKNFQEIAGEMDADLKGLAPDTFDDYLKGLCKFKRGSRSGNYYRDLFPEITPKNDKSN